MDYEEDGCEECGDKDIYSECAICYIYLCEDHAWICKGCLETVCPDHHHTCIRCENKIALCTNCLVTLYMGDKKLFVCEQHATDEEKRIDLQHSCEHKGMMEAFDSRFRICPTCGFAAQASQPISA